MEERIRPTKSGLFSIELLICVGVFVFCAAVCSGIFVRAELMSRESEELNLAVSEARSLAERWKASGGDLDRTAVQGGGRVEDGTLVLEREHLILRLSPEEGTLTATSDGRVLLGWTVAALPRTADEAEEDTDRSNAVDAVKERADSAAPSDEYADTDRADADSAEADSTDTNSADVDSSETADGRGTGSGEEAAP